LFFTQLIGMALGMSAKELGIGMEIVSAQTAIHRRVEAQDAVSEDESKPRRRRRTESGLPMPSRKGMER